jgi:mRNA-degrading endonuclease toxin of MazEF toxin-antitoxin module
MTRGDGVIVEFTYADGRRGKNRPALVIQNDRDNHRLSNTVVAMISGNVRHADEPTQVRIDPATSQGASSGLHGLSVVKCCNLYTVRQQDVLRVIGQISSAMLTEINVALKDALGLG